MQSDAALRFGGAGDRGDAAERCADVPRSTAREDRLRGWRRRELVVIAGLAKSKSEAFRLIEQGGVTVND